MAVACVFSLTKSPNLRGEIINTGAADMALEALHSFRAPRLKESEYLLAQLAVVSQMTAEPKFCRRLAAPEIIDLLVTIGRQGSEDDVLDEGSETSESGESRGRKGGEAGASEGEGKRTQPRRGNKISRVKVISSYSTVLRFCLVNIAENLGWNLYIDVDDGRGAGGARGAPSTKPTREDIAYMVVRRCCTKHRLKDTHIHTYI